MTCVRARTLVPLALTAAYALWTFWPDPKSMPGWGDPYFDVWSFEHVWRQMDRLGPLHLWSDRFWSAPIFAGMRLQLAFSENQLYPALILWPLRRTIGGPLALQWGAIAMTLAAFGCAIGFLRAIGLREMSGAGALLFACCGFVQSQYAHYQNICIFLLPLALWSWFALEQRPGPLRFALCAVAFGWIGGWNMYFQLFANLVLLVLVLARRSLSLRWRAAVAAGALVLQAPIAAKYLELQQMMGSLGVSTTYGAVAQSLVGTAMRPTLLQRFVPFYPAIEVPIEAAGFLGFSWTALLIGAPVDRRARPWAIAAWLAFWAALGLGHGLFDLIHLLPGLSGARAAGRFLVVTTLFGVPAALAVAHRFTGSWRWLPIALAIVELVPATSGLRVGIPRDLERRETELDVATRGHGPLLVVPRVDVRLQLYVLRSGLPLLQGLSGRAPANVQLVDAMLSERDWTATTLRDVLELTRAPLVAAIDATWIARLSSSELLEPRGCPEAFDVRVCLFQPRGLPPPARIRLQSDASWEYGSSAAGWPVARLRATRAGVLDYAELGRCRLLESTRLGVLSWTRELTFPGAQLLGARFDAGQVMFERESRQGIFALPGWLRPTRTYSVRCG
jgi:hypothetical protein